jgi:hypothetical protein
MRGGLPLVPLAAGVEAASAHDIGTIGLHVKPKRYRAALDVAAGVVEVEVSAPSARQDFHGGGQRPMLGLQLAQAIVAAMPRVYIQYHKAALGSGEEAGIGAGPTLPPVADHFLVKRRFLEAMF